MSEMNVSVLFFAFPATASLYKRMNSAVPGSASMRGPPFQAYQYVLTFPSASFLVRLFMPLSRIRILRGLPFIIGGPLRLHFRIETGHSVKGRINGFSVPSACSRNWLRHDPAS